MHCFHDLEKPMTLLAEKFTDGIGLGLYLEYLAHASTWMCVQVAIVPLRFPVKPIHVNLRPRFTSTLTHHVGIDEFFCGVLGVVGEEEVDTLQ